MQLRNVCEICYFAILLCDAYLLSQNVWCGKFILVVDHLDCFSDVSMVAEFKCSNICRTKRLPIIPKVC